MLGFTGKDCSDQDALDTCILDGLSLLIGDLGVDRNDDLAGVRVDDVLERVQACDSLRQGLNHDVLLFIDDSGSDDTVDGSAVLFVDDDILRDIDESSGQVTCLSGLESRIGQSLSGTVGGDEELDDRETFLEVALDRELDDVAVRLGHETTHTAELSDLGLGTSGSGVRHQEQRVEAVLALFQLCHELVCQLVVRLCPDVDHSVVALALGDLSLVVLVQNLGLLGVGLVHELLLGFRHDHVGKTDRGTEQCCILESDVLDGIAELDCNGVLVLLHRKGNQLLELLVSEELVAVLECDSLYLRQ